MAHLVQASPARTSQKRTSISGSADRAKPARADYSSVLISRLTALITEAVP